MSDLGYSACESWTLLTDIKWHPVMGKLYQKWIGSCGSIRWIEVEVMTREDVEMIYER